MVTKTQTKTSSGFFQPMLDLLCGDRSEASPLESACTDALTDVEKRSAKPCRLDYIIIANRGIIASMVIQEAHKSGKRVFVLQEQEDTPYPEHMLHTTSGDIVFPIVTHKDMKRKGDERTDIILMRRLRKIMEDMHIPSETVAIHPGYGFNSEDPEWNKGVSRYFKVLSPSHDWIELLGNKLEANAFCQDTDIPLPIGSGYLKSREEVRDFFRAHHTQVQRFLFKDVFGGGGKGQREVDASVSEETFLDIYENFSSHHPTFIINEFIVSNRHIEMQVMVDKDGHIRFGPMRDCTLQRGKQKIIEEIAIGISQEQEQFLRRNITAFFKKGEQKLGHPYEGLATFEMMYLPQEKKFFFLEVNTRIQVEHPVSGHQGGIQFIQTQFDIAEGRRLKSQEQLDAENRGGHTMEARICFERFLPEREREAFRKAMGVDIVTMPESGKSIHKLELPSGRDITVYMDNRMDTGAHGYGARMPNKQYDSMVIQLVVRGSTRERARRRLMTAVETLKVTGLNTNQELVLMLLKHPLFIRGEATSDKSIVTDAITSILEKLETRLEEEAKEACDRQKEERMRDLFREIQAGEMALSDAWASMDITYVLSSHLGLLKPTQTQIAQLLGIFGLSPNALQREENRVVLHFPLSVLVGDILDTFGCFGVHLDAQNTDHSDARFSVPNTIKPLFIGYLQCYGGVFPVVDVTK